MKQKKFRLNSNPRKNFSYSKFSSNNPIFFYHNDPFAFFIEFSRVGELGLPIQILFSGVEKHINKNLVLKQGLSLIQLVIGYLLILALPLS